MKKTKKNLGGRPTHAQEGQIETRILNAAAAMFFEHGYGATSIDALVQKACVSKRTFYDRFADKPDIFRAVVRHIITRIRPADSDALFTAQNFSDTLHTIALTYLRATLSPELIALHRLLLAEAPRFPELVQAVFEEGTRQHTHERIAELLSREAKSKNIKLTNPEFTAEQFMMMVIAAPQRRAMMGIGKPMNARDMQIWAGQATSLFLHGMLHA